MQQFKSANRSRWVEKRNYGQKEYEKERERGSEGASAVGWKIIDVRSLRKLLSKDSWFVLSID